MKVYTKTGDEGTTGLIGGTRVQKNDARLEAYGTVDELNSYVGLLTTKESVPELTLQFLRTIQNKLFSAGANLATDRSRTDLPNASLISEEDIVQIEKEIDRMELELAPLTHFVLPGGTEAGALCHICRTITRRAERRVYDLASTYEIDSQMLVFLNRLSDYFFVLSRYLIYLSGCQEIYWKTLGR